MRKGLFVDDESEMLQAFRKDLPSLCSDVEFDYANSGAQALTLLSMTRYDVVVTDLDMPKMDGVELLSKVAGQHPTAVRILISGHSDWKTNLRVMGPAHECLSKPCSPRDLAESIRQAMKLRDRLKDDRLKRLVSEIHALPTIPSLYLELLKALQDEDAPAERVAGIVSRDMSMSVKILQLVNSSVFGLPQPLSDATEAVIYLGVDTIKSLVLSLQVFSLFERVSVKGFSYGELWTHSLNTGVWSKRISEVENSDPIQVDQSFTAGLLHDVGKLVLAQGLPVRFGKAIELHLSKNISSWEAEMEIFNATHAEVGAYLLGLWGLPDPVVEAVALHHNPGAASHFVFSPLTATHAANGLIHENGSQSIHNALDSGYLDRIVPPDRVQFWREMANLLKCNPLCDSWNRMQIPLLCDTFCRAVVPGLTELGTKIGSCIIMKIWILWGYIALLLGGGWMGYSVGKSKVSLIMAVVFASLLALCLSSVLPFAWSVWLIAVLAIVFTMRFVKTKKFMPSGLMLAITVAALGVSLLF